MFLDEAVNNIYANNFRVVFESLIQTVFILHLGPPKKRGNLNRTDKFDIKMWDAAVKTKGKKHIFYDLLRVDLLDDFLLKWRPLWKLFSHLSINLVRFAVQHETSFVTLEKNDINKQWRGYSPRHSATPSSEEDVAAKFGDSVVVGWWRSFNSIGSSRTIKVWCAVGFVVDISDVKSAFWVHFTFLNPASSHWLFALINDSRYCFNSWISLVARWFRTLWRATSSWLILDFKSDTKTPAIFSIWSIFRVIFIIDVWLFA